MAHKCHKLSRVRLSKKKSYFVMKCVLPNCSYFINVKLAIGKMTLCYACDDPFMLTVNDLKLKPTCGKHKPQVEDDPEIDNLIRDLKLA